MSLLSLNDTESTMHLKPTSNPEFNTSITLGADGSEAPTKDPHAELAAIDALTRSGYEMLGSVCLGWDSIVAATSTSGHNGLGDAPPEMATLDPAPTCNDKDSEDPRSELIVVEAEVARVFNELQALMNKTRVLKSRINAQYSPIIRLLPPEIISEIFEACIPPFDMSNEITADNTVPLVLGSICGSWRKIAWTSPTLWTTSTLRLNTNALSMQMSLLDDWLSRSGDLPLSIRLVCEEDIHWSTPGTVIDVINKYAGRWCHLDLRIPTSCYKYLPQSSDKTFPLLISLNLNPPGGQGERKHRVDMSNSAQIQHLSLSCVYLMSMKFHWVHITHLRLEAFYVDECLETLRQTPRLVSCNLRNIIGGDDGHALPDEPVVLSALETLTIDNENDTHISVLLDSISIPNATQLSYSGRHLIHLPSICSLITRSAALQAFSLHQTVISNEDSFIQLLRSLKNVTKFVFSTRSNATTHTPLDDDLLRLCNPRLLNPVSECVMPKLQSFEYRGPQSFTWPMLLETLESRQASSGSGNDSTISGINADVRDEVGSLYARSKSISQLREFQLHLIHCEKDARCDAVISRLQALKVQGMVVRVTMSCIDLECKDHTYTFF